MNANELLALFGASIGEPLPSTVAPDATGTVVGCNVEPMVDEAGREFFAGVVRLSSGGRVYLFTDPAQTLDAL